MTNSGERMKQNIEKKNRLKDIKTLEVSLVSRGANNKKFFLVKSAEGDKTLAPEDFENYMSSLEGAEDALDKKVEGSESQNQKKGETMSTKHDLVKEEEENKEAPESGQEPAQGEPQKDEGASDNGEKPKEEGGDVSKGMSFEALAKRMENLEKENSELKKGLIEKEDAILTKEYIEISKSELSHLGVEHKEFGSVLKKISQFDKDCYDKVMSVLKAANATNKEAGLFKAHGSDATGSNDSDAWNKIEALAKGLVEKDSKLTQAQAIDRVLRTEDGRRLYADYKESQGV